MTLLSFRISGQGVSAFQLIQDPIPNLPSLFILSYFYIFLCVLLQQFLTAIVDVHIAPGQSHMNGIKIEVIIIEDPAHVRAFDLLFIFFFLSLFVFEAKE